MPWWIVGVGCGPGEAPGYVEDGDCASASTLDWVDGLDQDGEGGVDQMVVGYGDGWDLAFLGGPSTYQPSVGSGSVSLEVEQDGEVDWFVLSRSDSSYESDPVPLDGLFRIDDVRSTCPGDLYGRAPFLALPGVQRVDLWEDTTGDGVPELLVARQLYNSASLDLYLVDPTRTARSATIEDLALVHVAVARGESGPVADYDGDGRPEVVFLDLDRQSFVFLGTMPLDGDPIVPDAEIATIDVILLLFDSVAADLNGDGAADLALAYDQRVVCPPDYCLPVYTQRVIYGGPDLGALPLDRALQVGYDWPQQLLIADFDGDGLDDLATCDLYWGRGGPHPFHVEIYYGSPAGIGATPDSVVTLPTTALRASAGDVDGGGVADLLLENVYAEDSSLTEGTVLFRGEDGFTTPALVLDVEDDPYGDYEGIVTWGPLVDVDLDGHADVLARDVHTWDPSAPLSKGTSMNVFWGEPLP